jgi:carbohydrate-binding DOMON domain-containing protein
VGAVKKVFKSVGSLIGLGGSETPKIQQAVVEPTPTVVTDTSADTGASTEAKKNKKRRGFTSTQTATIAGESMSGGRSTLG